jgi:RimJ/RimL family protein N-acetyltransferase
VIETERLLLRKLTLDDLDELAAIFAKPEVFWWAERRGLTRDETEQMLRERFINR